MMTTVGPVAMDMYLPVLPKMSSDLGVNSSAVQLTISSCLMGMALGQLLVGRISDRFGRKSPVVGGMLIFAIASFLCAVASNVESLIALRFIQGLFSSVGIVTAQAIGRDIFSGTQLSRFYGRIAAITGAAAVVAPVIGGQLAERISWQGFFVVLGFFGLSATSLLIFLLPETLNAEHKEINRENRFNQVIRILAADKLFLGSLLTTSCTSGIYFAYLSSASFVLSGIYGLSASHFSWSFGINALGISLLSYLSGRYSEKYSPFKTFRVGMVIMTLSVLVMLGMSLDRTSLWIPILGYFLIAGGSGIIYPPSSTLALKDHPEYAATAASVLGVSRFAFASLVAPLVGISGTTSTTSLLLVISVCIVAALSSFILLVNENQATH
jgi:DHA1 family bicyclomycin/chloramphenicol resistance-like MFS transporter